MFDWHNETHGHSNINGWGKLAVATAGPDSEGDSSIYLINLVAGIILGCVH